MPQGQISKTKTKTTIVMEKELKAKLEECAKKNNRSLNNLMTTILSDFIKSKGI